jgi:peroxiredoxin
VGEGGVSKWILDELFGCLVADSAMITTPPASSSMGLTTTLVMFSPITVAFGCIAAPIKPGVDCGGRGAAATFVRKKRRVAMKLGLFLLLVSLALEAQGPVPRLAPDLKIVEASGKTTMLSAFRGRVVLFAFISTQCAHCQRASTVFEQLSHEFRDHLQVAEVAFDQDADTTAFTKRFGLSFPVGIGTSEVAHDFLGIARGERLGTPQVVVIDRSGVIRAQSERLGSPILQTYDYLRELLKALIKLQVTR